MADVGKREPGEQGRDDAEVKKPRLDDVGDVKKPSISLDALEKAKKALQLQKALKEKLKNLPQVI